MPISFTCPFCGVETNVSDQYAGQSGPCARCGKMVTVPSPGGAPVAAASSTSTVLVVCLVLGGLLVAGVFVIGVLVALLLPAINVSRDAARAAMCQNNLKQIAMAMMQYETMHGSFPPAYLADKDGKPMHSWRVLLLPYLDRQDLFRQYRFDEPWDGPNNRKLADKMPSIFRCPSDPDRTPSTTSYMVVAGPHTMFPAKRAISTASIRDGSSNTAMVVETVGMDVNWMEPKDLDETALEQGVVGPTGKGIGSLHRPSACVATADTACHRLNPQISRETLRNLFDPNDGKPLDTRDAFGE